jgi:hypothetical protein
MKHARIPINFEHYVNAMVHPITGCMISSYKKLMHDLATAKMWQTAFGKNFGGMVQGCNKTGQKGTNAMFVMMHDQKKHALMAKNFLCMQIQLLITTCKRTILTAFKSQWEVT